MQDLGQAKAYCVNTITQAIAPQFFAVLNALFELGKSTVKEQSPWRTFQESLRDIPDWNQKLIDEQTGRALAQCPQLEKLVSTAMMCQANQLANVRGIQLSVKDLPKISADRFIHDSYIRAAQELVHNPMLFGQSNAELSIQNREKIVATITQCMVAVIDSYVPISVIMSQPVRLQRSHTSSNRPSPAQRFSSRKLDSHRRPIPSLGAYDTDTFDSAQDPSLLLMDNDQGANPVEESSINDTAAPLVVEVKTPKIESQQAQQPLRQPPVEHSFIYAPSTVGNKLTHEAAKAMLNQTIA